MAYTAFPVIIESHMVLSPKFIKMVMVTTAKIILIIDLGFLYRYIPYITPDKAVLNVNPGKYAPLGYINIPKISAKAPHIPPYKGPNNMPHKANGKNPKLTLIIGVSTPKNLVSITCNEINKPRNTIFLVFFITAPPFIVFANRESDAKKC